MKIVRNITKRLQFQSKLEILTKLLMRISRIWVIAPAYKGGGCLKLDFTRKNSYKNVHDPNACVAGSGNSVILVFRTLLSLGGIHKLRRQASGAFATT